MRYQGRITTWTDDKGFGFITPNGGGEKVFVHISSFSNRQRRPEGNELVTYELKTDGKGRAQANTVAFVGEKPTPSTPPGRSNIPAICRLLSGICCWGSYRRSPPGCRSCALPCCKSRGLLRLRLRQVSRLEKSMANTRKHVALIRSSRWVARRLGGTAAASAQVGEGFLSSHLLGHRCAQLRSTRLVVFALWRKNASVCTGCRVRATHRFEGTACKLRLQVPSAPQAKRWAAKRRHGSTKVSVLTRSVPSESDGQIHE